MIKRIHAFMLGMKEFRLSFTTHLPSFNERQAYDRGRQFRHRLNFNHYED